MMTAPFAFTSCDTLSETLSPRRLSSLLNGSLRLRTTSELDGSNAAGAAAGAVASVAGGAVGAGAWDCASAGDDTAASAAKTARRVFIVIPPVSRNRPG